MSVWLAGESYAGTYLPLLAKLMLDARQNVGGIIVGSPWIDPLHQYASFVEYASTTGMVTDVADL